MPSVHASSIAERHDLEATYLCTVWSTYGVQYGASVQHLPPDRGRSVKMTAALAWLNVIIDAMVTSSRPTLTLLSGHG
jgi:hypothetical protein